jgi:hypothetical protein
MIQSASNPARRTVSPLAVNNPCSQAKGRAQWTEGRKELPGTGSWGKIEPPGHEEHEAPASLQEFGTDKAIFIKNRK